jgi:hypothetical protein
MMRKKRGYKRDTEVALLRDYKLFAIACEGGKREPGYFSVFKYASGRVSVDIIEDIISNHEMKSKHELKSAPRWVLDRAVKYIEKEGLSEEDDLWFVMDKDNWSELQLREIERYCKERPNWHLVLSNPCFEVWLYFHKRKDFKKSAAKKCDEFKFEISTFQKEGYHPFTFVPQLMNAITNAKAADSDANHFMPALKETKVYQLGESLMKFIGKNDFDDFVNRKIPLLIEEEKRKIRNSRTEKK